MYRISGAGRKLKAEANCKQDLKRSLLLGARAGHGIEWNANFGMNMEDAERNGMEDNLPYFHTNSILDFSQGIHRKIYTDSDN